MFFTGDRNIWSSVTSPTIGFFWSPAIQSWAQKLLKSLWTDLRNLQLDLFRNVCEKACRKGFSQEGNFISVLFLSLKFISVLNSIWFFAMLCSALLIAFWGLIDMNFDCFAFSFCVVLFFTKRLQPFTQLIWIYICWRTGGDLEQIIRQCLMFVLV